MGSLPCRRQPSARHARPGEVRGMEAPQNGFQDLFGKALQGGLAAALLWGHCRRTAGQRALYSPGEIGTLFGTQERPPMSRQDFSHELQLPLEAIHELPLVCSVCAWYTAGLRRL